MSVGDSRHERENQLLLDCFTEWCLWSAMKIRFDKCLNFGLKKLSTRSMQFQRRQEFSDEGLTLPTRGLKYGFQGTINAKNLQQNRVSLSDGGLACSDGGYSPLALPWRHPWIHLQSYHQKSYFYIILRFFLLCLGLSLLEPFQDLG